MTFLTTLSMGNVQVPLPSTICSPPCRLSF